MGDGDSRPDGETVRPSKDVQLLVVADRAALFHARRQELYDLNDTARIIWEGVAASGSLSHVAFQLADLGASPAEASRFVDDAVSLWLRTGWLVPASVERARAGAPERTYQLAILDVGFTVEAFGVDLPRFVLDCLAPLRGESDAPSRLSVVGWRDQYYLFLDDEPRGLFRTDELAPGLKALLTERLIARVQDGFVTHGALLEACDTRIFITGEPGAGKSTLALKLQLAGFRCLADDIVLVDQASQMRGAPFSPTLKTGSWPLFGPEAGLELLLVHSRRDGKNVKYAAAAVEDGPAKPTRIFISLARTADAAARLEPLPPLQCLQLMLESAFAAKGSVTTDQMAGLATAFSAMHCYRLHYSALDEALALLQRTML